MTVGAGLFSYVPLIGEGLQHLLLGGPEVGAATLSRFYTLHVMLIPLLMLLVGLYHIWRVRKDGFSRPRRVDEQETVPVQMRTTLPHLVSREGVYALVVLALLLAWATYADAPLLLQSADPAQPPDPAKAAWYFAGLQELLFHFHPSVGAFVIPALLVTALIALPYLRDEEDRSGIWFRSVRGRSDRAVEPAAGRGRIVRAGPLQSGRQSTGLTAVFAGVDQQRPAAAGPDSAGVVDL